MDEEKYYIGSDLKFAITVTGEGFDMTQDDYGIELVCGTRRHEVDMLREVVTDEDGVTYLLVDSTRFGSGVLRMIVTANVPDNDFDDFRSDSTEGYRREVAVADLCELRRTT